MQDKYTPRLTPVLPDHERQWLQAARQQLAIIVVWLSSEWDKSNPLVLEPPTVEIELGHPVMRMRWVSPAERLQSRPLGLQDDSMPAQLRDAGRIDWVTEDTVPRPMITAPYSSRFCGTVHCTLLRLPFGGVDGPAEWCIYIPFGSTRLQHIRRSAIGTVELTRTSFSEVSSALLVR
jgi:hypothetical protein